ncbi:DMT family transporter [Roseibium sp.]|uniref:DMT family transporter n=1 Tax=Roseibium sp. TaxID=1936156 RepID=UPI003B52F8A2
MAEWLPGSFKVFMERQKNSQAIAAMLVAMAGFILNDTLVKMASDAVPLGQIILVRGLICIAVLSIAGYVTGMFQNARVLMHPAVLVRAFAETAATLLYLTALFQLPIANATAILQVLPLVVTAAAAVFLKSPVGWRRWSAIMIGFTGVLIIIRPGLEGFNVFSLIALAGVGCMALRDLATRQLPADVPTLGVALISFVAVTLLGAALTFASGWVPLSFTEIGYLSGAAGFVLAGYVFIILAMRLGEIAVVAPFRYSIVVWAIALGYLVWGDIPDVLTLVGIAIVIFSGTYSFIRERRLGAAE